MLAFMPKSQPLHAPSSLPSPAVTMSLAVLPSSPIGYGQTAAPTFAQLLPAGPSPSKRPKLTLDTSAAPSAFGKGSTSLRLETLSATSPTVRNTFQNGYHTVQQLRAPGVRRPLLKPLSTDVPQDTVRKPTPLHTELSNSSDSSESSSASASAVSASSASTIDSLPAEVPYKLAYNVVSILSNSPLPKIRVRRTTLAQSKPMFPLAKKVSFKAPLTEDIKTSRYTMAHSDIESSASTISTLELPAQEYPFKKIVSEKEEDPKQRALQTSSTTVASPQTGDKRESDEEDDDDSATYPTTPVAGRRKRHRQWVWTLGPVDGKSGAPESEVIPASAGDKDQVTA